MRSRSLWVPKLVAALAAVAVAIAPLPSRAFSWPWGPSSPWPDSSDRPVEVLDHPTVESVFAARHAAGLGGEPYRFAAFGDQRALADGEWQELLRQIVRWERENGEFAFLLDTGDIVKDGRHTDQFAWLAENVLSIAPHLPYLVGFGNHEVKNNADPVARENAVRFLSYLDEDLAPDRLWYRKDLGAATFLFLDTNDLVYGPDGDRKSCPIDIDPETREGRQLKWLRAQFAELRDREPSLVVAILHHPPIQSSKMHRTASCSVWNLQDDGEFFLDILANGGVDVVLTGHTHTYERFRLVRDDDREIHVVNVSGRPRDSFLAWGSGRRRPRDLAGREEEFFSGHGWLGLDRWTVHQEDVMRNPDDADQFAIFTVGANGELTMEILFLDEDSPDGTRSGKPGKLH